MFLLVFSLFLAILRLIGVRVKLELKRAKREKKRAREEYRKLRNKELWRSLLRGTRRSKESLSWSAEDPKTGYPNLPRCVTRPYIHCTPRAAEEPRSRKKLIFFYKTFCSGLGFINEFQPLKTTTKGDFQQIQALGCVWSRIQGVFRLKIANPSLVYRLIYFWTMFFFKVSIFMIVNSRLMSS